MTSLDICNTALSHLGEAPIAAMDAGTTAARACNALYAPTLDEVLRSHRWNFATSRVVIDADEYTAPAFGWSYWYPLPDDCLRVCEVNGSDNGDSKDWTIEGRSLLSNQSECNMVYIARVDDVDVMDALFVQALSLKLAQQLTEVIRGTTGKTAELGAQYERITAPLARRIDANETRRKKGLVPMRSAAIQARLGVL